ncbi:glycosyltransferase family 4 protein [Altericista sp. CCNU0014]|uniref:glycosyltransferase family 4 protein n=1 Tax=Altericista sp. CCNU0014 TaxID=3082949 RepID=UPI00384D6ED9
MTYPPMGGEYLRNWQTINILRQLGPVAVFSISDRALRPPELDGVVLWQHYDTSQDRSPRSQVERFAQWVRQCGLTYYCPYRAAAARALEETVDRFKPDLVVLEQLWLIPYLAVLQKRPCRIIYDAHNVEAPLYRATKCQGSGLRSLVRNTLHLSQIRRDEQTLTRQTSCVWACSDRDRTQLHQRYGDTFVSAVVVNGVDPAFYRALPSDANRELEGVETGTATLILTGNFAHLPNARAAEILISDLYPRLKPTYPQLRLLLVGRHPTAAMQAAAGRDPNIVVTGEVPDVRPYLAIASVAIVPLQEGSGTRLKILEAFAAGCPVVSSTKGAEGLAVRDGEHLLIRDGIDAMMQGVQLLWDDPALKAQMLQSARRCLQSDYSWESARVQAQTVLQALFSDAEYDTEKKARN